MVVLQLQQVRVAMLRGMYTQRIVVVDGVASVPAVGMWCAHARGFSYQDGRGQQLLALICFIIWAPQRKNTVLGME